MLQRACERVPLPGPASACSPIAAGSWPAAAGPAAATRGCRAATPPPAPVCRSAAGATAGTHLLQQLQVEGHDGEERVEGGPRGRGAVEQEGQAGGHAVALVAGGHVAVQRRADGRLRHVAGDGQRPGQPAGTHAAESAGQRGCAGRPRRVPIGRATQPAPAPCPSRARTAGGGGRRGRPRRAAAGWRPPPRAAAAPGASPGPPLAAPWWVHTWVGAGWWGCGGAKSCPRPATWRRHVRRHSRLRERRRRAAAAVHRSPHAAPAPRGVRLSPGCCERQQQQAEERKPTSNMRSCAVQLRAERTLQPRVPVAKIGQRHVGRTIRYAAREDARLREQKNGDPSAPRTCLLSCPRRRHAAAMSPEPHTGTCFNFPAPAMNALGGLVLWLCPRLVHPPGHCRLPADTACGCCRRRSTGRVAPAAAADECALQGCSRSQAGERRAVEVVVQQQSDSQRQGRSSEQTGKVQSGRR